MSVYRKAGYLYAKVTFGAEPKDYEMTDFVLKNYYWLRFSPAVAADVKEAVPQSETDAARGAETGTEYRDRHEVAAGFEITAGAVRKRNVRLRAGKGGKQRNSVGLNLKQQKKKERSTGADSAPASKSSLSK